MITTMIINFELQNYVGADTVTGKQYITLSAAEHLEGRWTAFNLEHS